MISAGQCRYEGIKLEILKSFSLVFALSTSILHFAIAFVALASLSVNMPLFKKVVYSQKHHFVHDPV